VTSLRTMHWMVFATSTVAKILCLSGALLAVGVLLCAFDRQETPGEACAAVDRGPKIRPDWSGSFCLRISRP